MVSFHYEEKLQFTPVPKCISP